MRFFEFRQSDTSPTKYILELNREEAEKVKDLIQQAIDRLKEEDEQLFYQFEGLPSLFILMERLDTLVLRYKELMMASFEKTERDIRLNHQGYSLWQKGSYYPSRVLMLDCPDGSTWSYQILQQVQEHVKTGKPQTDHPDSVLDRWHAENEADRKQFEKIMKGFDYGKDE